MICDLRTIPLTGECLRRHKGRGLLNDRRQNAILQDTVIHEARASFRSSKFVRVGRSHRPGP